jgi:hypothetical protein
MTARDYSMEVIEVACRTRHSQTLPIDTLPALGAEEKWAQGGACAGEGGD